MGLGKGDDGWEVGNFQQGIAHGFDIDGAGFGSHQSFPFIRRVSGHEIHVYTCIQVFAKQKECEVVELNVQVDHVHLLVLVPPKVSISELMGTLKGRTAIRVFKQFPYLEGEAVLGESFWARGYCVDTVGLDAEMIRKYVKYQEAKDRRSEQLGLKY